MENSFVVVLPLTVNQALELYDVLFELEFVGTLPDELQVVLANMRLAGIQS